MDFMGGTSEAGRWGIASGRFIESDVAANVTAPDGVTLQPIPIAAQAG
jgi:hypothetical protein